MSATYPPEPWTLVGRMDLSTFFVPAADLPRATWPDGWRPLAVAGRVPVDAAWVDYAPGGVLSYRELLVAVAGRVGARLRPHICSIWVDSPASRDGGRALWGIPKGLATFDGFDAGTPAFTVEGAPRPTASAILRRGPRLPGRPRLAFTLAQELDGATLHSPVATRTRLGGLSADWTFDPDGALDLLAGRRPVVSMTMHGFAMLFGMTPFDRAQESREHADRVRAVAQRQESPPLDAGIR